MPYNIKYFRGNVHVFLHIFVYYVLMENFDSAVQDCELASQMVQQMEQALNQEINRHQYGLGGSGSGYGGSGSGSGYGGNGWGGFLRAILSALPILGCAGVANPLA